MGEYFFIIAFLAFSISLLVVAYQAVKFKPSNKDKL